VASLVARKTFLTRGSDVFSRAACAIAIASLYFISRKRGYVKTLEVNFSKDLMDQLEQIEVGETCVIARVAKEEGHNYVQCVLHRKDGERQLTEIHTIAQYDVCAFEDAELPRVAKQFSEFIYKLELSSVRKVKAHA
jgi:hypothetical protein